MPAFSLLGDGFARMWDPWLLMMCFFGTFAGTLVGVLPGLGPSAAIAVLLPLTFGADPLVALVALAGIYYGAMYGGTITSVMLNLPGESASVVTTYDGYPLARQGRGGAALGVAAVGSFIAGTIGPGSPVGAGCTAVIVCPRFGTAANISPLWFLRS